MNAWAISSSVLRRTPVLTGQRILTIPRGAQVQIIEPDGEWRRVAYKNYTGWVFAELLDPILPAPAGPQTEPVVEIEDHLFEPGQNAAQYIRVDGKVKYNLCGQFCAAQIVDISIGDLLAAWRYHKRLDYLAIVPLDSGTGPGTVAGMLASAGREAEPDFRKPLTHPIAGLLVSPARLAQKLAEGWQLVLGVNINKISGQVIASEGIQHWVNLVSVTPWGVNDGLAEIYNPFSNRFEQVPWPVLWTSTEKKWGRTQGIWFRPTV